MGRSNSEMNQLSRGKRTNFMMLSGWQATRVVLCLFLFFSFLFPSTMAQNVTEDLKEDVQLTRSYERLFMEPNKTDEPSAISSSSNNVAICGYWFYNVEETHDRGRRVAISSSAVYKFVGFVEGRLQVKVPAEWVSDALSGVFRSTGELFFEQSGEVNQDDFVVDSHKAVTISRLDERWDVGYGNENRFVINSPPRNVDGVTVVEDDSTVFFCFYNVKFADGSVVYAFSRNTNRQLWSRKTPGTLLRGTSGGGWWNRTRLVSTNGRLVVFGSSLASVSITSIGKVTGTLDFCFCSSFVSRSAWERVK